MSAPIIHWEQLPAPTRNLVEQQIGPVLRAEPVNAGLNHQLAVILHISTGAVFAKAIDRRDKRHHRLDLEAAVAPIVATTSPRLVGHLPSAEGWSILLFQAIANARHADLSPQSGDLELVSHALDALAVTTSAPPPVTDRIERRWAEYCDPHTERLLRGGHLLHTDLGPDNILVDGRRAWIVDWSWPTLGAAWIDPACLALWLIAQGHLPAEAQTWLRAQPAARNIPADALDAFIAINARMWSRIADDDPQPWKTQLAIAATAWVAHRSGDSVPRPRPRTSPGVA